MDKLLVIAKFKERPDRLFWRMYEFNFDKSIEEKSISEKRKIKIIYEKYLRNKTLPNYRDIAVREFNLAMNSIHVEYHFGEGQITRPGRLFHKPLVSGKDIQFDEDLVIENEVYPYENKLKPFEAYLMLKDMMEAEYEARRDLSRLETNVSSILKTRISECLKFQLIVESLDWDRNTKNKQLLQNEKDKVRAFKKREKAKQIEYALPYLEVATKPLTEQSAKIIRDKIISDFRQSTKYQFVKARNSLIKKQFALKSMMNSLESDVFENIEQKKKMTTLCSTLKSKLDMLLLKMERFKEKQIEKYNNLALYL
ncbi:uncharacterized protein LOC126897275, partial [Daktulosphaira vitifoliae]|uniref:uncharacterized protein LOC126897275 n=1 Tax=Daktulosphaira vitifoliae TaxID=58002 RepID=UPI0021AA1DBA